MLQAQWHLLQHCIQLMLQAQWHLHSVNVASPVAPAVTLRFSAFSRPLYAFFLVFSD
jgi:hypothetical protein